MYITNMLLIHYSSYLNMYYKSYNKDLARNNVISTVDIRFKHYAIVYFP